MMFIGSIYAALVRLAYTLLLGLISPLLLRNLYKKKDGKPSFGSRWKEHFGFTPISIATQPIWIHAVSVGEVLAATPLIKAILSAKPNTAILVTTTTSTGAEQVEKLGSLVEHRYMPIDFAFAVRGFLKAVNPSQLIIIETELWPNTLITVSHAGIPITVVNARLSEKSYLNYKKIRPLFNLISPRLNHLLCQSDADAKRFCQLGVAQDRITVTGSIKFDIPLPKQIKQQGNQFREQLGRDRPIWIAASTHKGEDELILSAHQKVLEQIPNALLILVPRHPERFDDVFALCKKMAFHTVRRTDAINISGKEHVYLGDTMGEMLILLGAADLCFMGGSLIGNKVGGHNVLEPAALGVPVITGPSYFNFKEIVDILLTANGILVCPSDTLSIHVSSLLQDPDQRQVMQNAALEVVQHNQGALQKTLNMIMT